MVAVAFDHFAYPYATNTEKDIAIGVSRQIYLFLSTYEPQEVASLSTQTILQNPIEMSDFLFVIDIIENSSHIQIVPDNKTGQSIETGCIRAATILNKNPVIFAIASSSFEAVKRYIQHFSENSLAIEETSIPERLRTEVAEYFSNWEDDLYKLGIRPPLDFSQCDQVIRKTPTILLEKDPTISPKKTLKTRLTSVIVIKPWRIQNLEEEKNRELSFYAKEFPGVNLPLLRVAKHDFKTLEQNPDSQEKRRRFNPCLLF